MPNPEHSVSLSSTLEPDISIVGGKAASLIRLTQAGLNVPEGCVLTVGFFDEWANQLSTCSHVLVASLLDPSFHDEGRRSNMLHMSSIQGNSTCLDIRIGT